MKNRDVHNWKFILFEGFENDADSFYYPTEDYMFVGTEFEANQKASFFANQWENKSGSLCGKILIEAHGKVEAQRQLCGLICCGDLCSICPEYHKIQKIERLIELGKDSHKLEEYNLEFL